ncbi:MAG: response regulator transcription factor [Eubacterium sp.]|nr:response regulator transcription factor [Eubacterium sp.]
MYKIMIIEDDETMALTIKRQIESWGNEVLCADDFQNIMPDFVKFDPHMVLVDLMLPFYNGYYWCTEIRKISNVPVIFLSSASDNMNIVMAMNMGGDDFIPKPVDLNVLTAKLQAALRRAYDMGGKIPVLEHRGAVLNLNDASLTYMGKRIELTKNDFRILQLLLEQKGKVVSRDTLMTKLWQMDSYVEENTLTVNVTRLRKKLEKAGLTDFIMTKVGSGYLIE